MAEDTNYFLSDEFVAFSTKIARIHESKKALKSELKTFYEHIKEQEKALDDEAKSAEKEFSDWKKTVKNKTEE
jgi:predicted  nucleic acid-binding Zn-ribbon protein